jgi:cyclic dehypoxanthinyl futalosine synthase
LTLDQIREAIAELGFLPRQRDVFYELVDPQREQTAIEANRRLDASAPAAPIVTTVNTGSF